MYVYGVCLPDCVHGIWAICNCVVYVVLFACYVYDVSTYMHMHGTYDVDTCVCVGMGVYMYV